MYEVINKILVIGPSWVGDMVMAQVLFKLIKRAQPTVQLHVLAPKWSIAILQRMPEVDKAICSEIEHNNFALTRRIALARELRANAYIQAIILPNSWKSALIPWLAKIPRRTAWLGECRWGLVNDLRYLNKAAFPRLVDRYAALAFDVVDAPVRHLPVPHLESDKANLAVLLNKFSIALNKSILALCPGAAFGPAKRWLPEYYVSIAQEKIRNGWQIWLFGSEHDLDVLHGIEAKLPQNTLSFAGKIDLLETVDLMSQVTAVVTNDSGLLHVAASLNKPLVAIYGSTSPEYTPPLGEKSKSLKVDLPCSPCFKRECPLQHFKCMRMIEPQQVLDALLALEQM